MLKITVAYLIHAKWLSMFGGKGLCFKRELFSAQLSECANMLFGYLCCRCVGNTSR